MHKIIKKILVYKRKRSNLNYRFVIITISEIFMNSQSSTTKLKMKAENINICSSFGNSQILNTEAEAKFVNPLEAAISAIARKTKIILFGLLIFFVAGANIYAQKTMNKVWERPYVAPNGSYNPLKFSYDGKKIICIGSRGGDVNNVYVLDAQTGDSLANISFVSHSLADGDADISYDGKYLAVTCPLKSYSSPYSSYYPYIGIYETENFKLVDSIPIDNGGGFWGSYVVRFSPDGKRIFSLTKSYSEEYIWGCSRLVVTDIATKKVLSNQAYSSGKMLELTRDGKYYIVGLALPYGSSYDVPDGEYYICDASSYETKYSIYPAEAFDENYRYSYPAEMKISKDNKLYFGNSRKKVKVYDLEDEAKLISDCIHPNFNTMLIVLTNDGNYFTGTVSYSDWKVTEIESDPTTCEEKNKIITSALRDSYEDMYAYSWSDVELNYGIGVYSYNSDIKEAAKPMISVEVIEEQLHINLILEQYAYLSMNLFDQSGKDLGLIKEGYFEGSQVVTYNTHHLSSGIYFVNINGESYKFAVVKQYV